MGLWTKYDMKLSMKVACFDIMNTYLKTIERCEENILVAILPGVDFSLGLPSKDILKQFRLVLALNLNNVEKFQEGGKIPTPMC